MKVTGYKLRETIKQHELRRDTAASSFTGSLKAFPGEEKQLPTTVVGDFLESERAIAKLQTAQMRYNLAVMVDAVGETMTLAEAIKRVGGEGRAEKMWRSAAGPKKDRYGSPQENDTFDPAMVRATSTLTVANALRLATAAARIAGGLRAAIATANAKEVEIEGLSPVLFE